MFSSTDIDSPIHIVSLALMASKGDVYHSSGSAVIVAKNLALTARHVLDDYWKSFDYRTMSSAARGSFSLVGFNICNSGRTGAVFSVTRTWSLPSTDLALLRLTPFSQEAEKFKWQLPILDMTPPNIGDEIDGFGYHSSHAEPLKGSIAWHTSPASSPGVVRAVHLEKRDRATLHWPCFQTTARFDGGMSGGAVFNKAGRLCGIICSSLPSTTDEPDIEHASYVSLLWPVLGIPIDELYDNPPVAAPYTLFDLAKHAGCNIHGLNQVDVVRTQTGQILSVKFTSHNNA
jgi:hypothetical protein